MKLRFRNPLIEGTVDEIREATIEREREDVIRAARRMPWRELAANDLELHRSLYIDDANDVVLEACPDVWARGDMLHASANESLVVAWFISPVDNWPIYLRVTQRGPRTASAYREAIARKGDSSARRRRRPTIAPPPEPLPEGVLSISRGRLGGKQIGENHDDEVRSRRLELARSAEAWEEIPETRLVRRGPFLVDAETDLVYTRRAGSIFETGRATIEHITLEAPLAFYTDEGGNLFFLERHGTAKWAELYAKKIAVRPLRRPRPPAADAGATPVASRGSSDEGRIW